MRWALSRSPQYKGRPPPAQEFGRKRSGVRKRAATWPPLVKRGRLCQYCGEMRRLRATGNLIAMATPLAIVLAAGAGTRMNSDLPKVLHSACGKPLVAWVLAALRQAGVGRLVVVVGHRSDLVRAALADEPNVEFVEQTQRLGTGHAVAVCRDAVATHEGPVVVLAGDSPLVQASSLARLLTDFREQQRVCVLGTLHKSDPTGLGRVVRDAAGKFQRIVEQKDATEEERRITEVNMSTYVFDRTELFAALAELRNENRQGEYYLTDVPSILLAQGKSVEALAALLPCESLSVNTLDELRTVEAEMRRLGY